MWIMRSIRRPLVQFRAASAAAANFSSSAAALEAERSVRDGARNDWRKEEIKSIYDSPILDLLFHAVCCLHFIFLMKNTVFQLYSSIENCAFAFSVL